MAAPAAPAQMGKLFGLPGLSRELTQFENADGIVTTLSGTAQTQLIGMQPFMQSDVITHWEFQATWANTQGLGGGANTTSAYFPYNIFQTTKLVLQNQFAPIDVESGIDLAIFQAYRPFDRTGPRTDVLYTNFNTMYSNQTNQISAGNYTNGSTSIKFRLEIPVSLWFDQYFQLAENGSILNGGMPIRALVTPELMAGTAKLVTPSILYAAASAPGGTLDNSPLIVTGGAPTYSGSMTLHILRHGYYQPDRPETIPPIYDWRYQRISRRYLVGAASRWTQQIPFTGQILSVFVRLWDPTLNSNAGGPVVITNVTESSIIYGSSLYREQNQPVDTQAAFVRKYLFLPTSGVLLWDFATNRFGEVSNAGALNTLTTSGVSIKLVFSGTQASSCYAVIGVEGLSFVQSS